MATAHAQTFNLSKGLVVLNAQLGSNVFHDTDFATGNPDFTNEVAHIMEKGSLLPGGEAQTSRYHIDANEGAADNSTLFYSINGGPVESPGLPGLTSNLDVWQQADFSGMVEIGKTLRSVAMLLMYFSTLLT